MNQFYVSIIFVGVVLVIISLLWVLMDIKKSKDYDSKMEGKKQELEGIIRDAELMVDELNKFSDYIVTSIDSKNEEMSTMLKDVEDRINKAKSFVYELAEDKVVNGSSVSVQKNKEIKSRSKLAGNKKDTQKTLEQDIVEGEKPKQKTRQKTKEKEKVIHINNRYSEVLSLADNGLSDTEIAKQLNMGKGEIQLILGVSKK